MALMRSPMVQKLRELIAAIDRRVPHAERPAEMGIARDAAALKARALTQIEELEQNPASVD
jgi:hypothetical protein